MRRRQALDDAITSYLKFERDLADNIELIELGEQEGDGDVVAEAESFIKILQRESQSREIAALLSGEADANNSYLEIHAGAGGTESQDWAQMLLRMYTRWAEGRGFKVEVIGTSPGEEAGIKSASLLIKGPSVYGWLKTESGVHRLVRNLALRFRRAAPYELRLRLSLSGDRRFHRNYHRRQGCSHRHLPGERRGGAAR